MKKWLIFAIFILCFPNWANADEPDHITNIVISFDGMRHDFLQHYVEEGNMPYFKNITEKGIMGQHVETVFPSLTSASHAAIATGASPNTTGMVSNQLHKPDKTLTQNDSAFFSHLDAEPLWSVARKHGKKTATILFPGSHPDYGNQADYAVYYGHTWASSHLIPIPFQKEETSNFMKASIQINLEKEQNKILYIKAKDGPHGEYRFNVSLIPTMRSATTVNVNEWGEISFQTKENDLAGFAFKIKAKKADLSDAKLYHTAITSATIFGPTGFKEEINEHFGYFPVQDDDGALEKKWITRKEYEEISMRFAKWTTDVSLYIKMKYKPDLMYMYYPQIDHESHKYLLVDPRQPEYSPKKSAQYMDYIRWSYQLSDEMLGQVLLEMDKQERIFLVSDHGMEPVHSRLSPNEVLEKEGLLVKDQNGDIDLKQSEAYAISSGSIAHVYINLQRREKGGIVSQNDYKKTQQKISDLFRNTKVDHKSIPIFKYIPYITRQMWNKIISTQDPLPKTILPSSVRKTRIHPYEKVIVLDPQQKHENAGDILLVSKKGYYMAQDDGKKVLSANDLGNHGGNPSRKELQPIFLVAGHGISKGEIQSKRSTLDIAPTLYELLDIPKPHYVEGEIIQEIIEQDH